MTILDTNVWVAYFNVADSLHAKAVKLFDNLDGGGLVIPEYLMLEITTVLSIRASKQTADRFLDSVLDNRDITVLFAHRELFLATVAAYQAQATAKLSFVDAALVVLSSDYTVVTFDRALAKAIKTAKP